MPDDSTRKMTRLHGNRPSGTEARPALVAGGTTEGRALPNSFTPFSSTHCLQLLAGEGVICLNQCWTHGDEEERNQNENDEGRDHLDGSFGGLLFGALAAGGA